MFKASPKIIRSNYLWNYFKKIISEKSLTITEVAKKMWTTQPALSRSLNWNMVSSDNLFLKVWNSIWLTEKEIQEIFKNADIEEYKYKYGDDILEHREMTDEEIDEVIRKKYNLSKEEFERLARAVKN